VDPRNYQRLHKRRKVTQPEDIGSRVPVEHRNIVEVEIRPETTSVWIGRPKKSSMNQAPSCGTCEARKRRNDFVPLISGRSARTPMTSFRAL
jgi:hypothetical protein